MIKKIWEAATNFFIEESAAQYKKGMERYGVPLTSFNGRNPFKDAREEVIDMHQYLTQAEQEFRSVALILYVYSMTEGFFKHLPPHIQQKLLQVADGAYISDICKEEGINFYGTVKHIGPKDISSGPELGTNGLQEPRYSTLSGADDPHNN